MTPAAVVATCAGIGRLPEAPGTWASLAAIPLGWGLHALGGFWLVGPATIAVIALGWWAAGAYTAGMEDDDPAEVVIDEVAGMLIALWPLSLGLTITGAEPHVFPWPGWVLGFLLFRFFDILKPPPVRWADRLPGPAGVMLDDIVAGALTAVIALAAAGVAHGWL